MSRLRNSIGSLWGARAEKKQAAAGARGRAASLNQQSTQLADRLEDAQRALLQATATHDNLSRQLRRTEAQIVSTRRRTQIAARRYENQRRLLGQRLGAMQRSGRLGYLQLILSSRSLTELSRRAYYFNAVASRDSELKAQLQADRLELERMQNLLMSQWAQRRRIAAAANRERVRIASVASQQQSALRELNSDRQALLSYAAAQEQSARELEGMINELSAQRAAAAAEQARAARAARYRNRRYSRYARHDARGESRRMISPVAGGRLAPMRVREVAYYDQMSPADSDGGGSLRDSLSMEEGHSAHDGHDHSSDKWATPVRGRLSSRFGMRYHPVLRRRKLHTGDDLAASYGSPFKAARGGTVLWAGWKKAYGKTVIVDHGDGVATLYGHASKVNVRPGQTVKSGEYLGNVGSTGWSTGPHLHFEVRKNGKPVNPRAFLRKR